MGSLLPRSGDALAQGTGRGQARLLTEVACLRWGEDHSTFPQGVFGALGLPQEM